MTIDAYLESANIHVEPEIYAITGKALRYTGYRCAISAGRQCYLDIESAQDDLNASEKRVTLEIVTVNAMLEDIDPLTLRLKRDKADVIFPEIRHDI